MPVGGGDEHEIDFVLRPGEFLEVKRGDAPAIDFAWFPKSFPGGRLTVIGSSRFETDRIRGVTVEDFLLTGPRSPASSPSAGDFSGDWLLAIDRGANLQLLCRSCNQKKGARI